MKKTMITLISIAALSVTLSLLSLTATAQFDNNNKQKILKHPKASQHQRQQGSSNKQSKKMQHQNHYNHDRKYDNHNKHDRRNHNRHYTLQKRNHHKNHSHSYTDIRSHFFYPGIINRHNSRLSFSIRTTPIGTRVKFISPGHTSFYMGRHHYFYVNATYYLWEPANKHYIVVEKPTEELAYLEELIIYPAKGQSDLQRDKDKEHCTTWADKETKIDSAPNTINKQHRRAMSACLEALDYVVK